MPQRPTLLQAVVMLLLLSLWCAVCTFGTGFVLSWLVPQIAPGWPAWVLIGTLFTLGPFLALSSAALAVYFLAGDAETDCDEHFQCIGKEAGRV